MKTQLSLIFSLLLVMSVSSHQASASDLAPLDPPYSHIKGVKKERSLELLNRLDPASNTENLISLQTSVKSQVSRGTCSIFSATAILESHLISMKGFPQTLDLSEEWLEYVAVRGRTSDGSNSDSNFSLIREQGIPDEETMPYIGQAWEDMSLSGLIFERCGHLANRKLESCLLTHWDPELLDLRENELLQKSPEFASARAKAYAFRDSYIRYTGASFYIDSKSVAKKMLLNGTPVTMDIDFYYGAWNHRVAPELGIERNLNHWDNGIVGYPESDSLDRKKSPSKAAGHSVVLVGYDDDVVVETEVQMTDGKRRKFIHVGVYYFKNSWGTEGFGRTFTLNGTSYPGYGMITQDYVHDYGAFFRLPLK